MVLARSRAQDLGLEAKVQRQQQEQEAGRRVPKKLPLTDRDDDNIEMQVTKRVERTIVGVLFGDTRTWALGSILKRLKIAVSGSLGQQQCKPLKTPCCSLSPESKAVSNAEHGSRSDTVLSRAPESCS